MRRRREGEITHPVDCGGCRSPLSTSVRLMGDEIRPDIIEIKRSVRGKRTLEREGVEVLVLLAQAVLNGLFGLAHEAVVADCYCLAVCCSDMQDYTVCSHRGRER